MPKHSAVAVDLARFKVACQNCSLFQLCLPVGLDRGDLDALFDFRQKAPGMPFAHPTVEHFAPLFVTLGAVAQPDRAPDYTIEGFAYGLSKRSFQAR